MIQSKCPLLEPVKFVVDGLALKIMEEKNDEIKRTLLKYNFGGNKFYQEEKDLERDNDWIWSVQHFWHLFRGVFLGQVFKLVFRH